MENIPLRCDAVGMSPKRKAPKSGSPEDAVFVDQVSIRITQSQLDKLDELERRIGPLSTRAQISRVAFEKGLDSMLKDYTAGKTTR
jgi:predicted DNA-binding protein